MSSSSSSQPQQQQQQQQQQLLGESGVKRPREEVGQGPKEAGGAISKSKMNSAWSFMKAPTEKDIRGKRRTGKAFDAPIKPYDYLIVMDFEWTCDNTRRVDPLEIIEFPAVLVSCQFPPRIVDQFQVYCRPTVNPKLSKFCTELTAITQDMVDSGVRIGEAIERHAEWLRGHGLVGDGEEEGLPRFAVVTWGDSDVMTALDSEIKRLGIERPPHFKRWINLKALFKGHYKREPKGGLQKCVEGCGLSFDGRAHSGLVDSINTAKICVQMLEQGYQFKRSTRGFGPGGTAWGSKPRGEGGEGSGQGLERGGV